MSKQQHPYYTMPPMPRVFNPSPPDAGPGSAFAGTSLAKKRSRRRQKVRSRSHSPQTSPTNSRRTSRTTDTAEPAATNSTTITTISTQQQQFIGQDILDWHDENEHNSTSGNNLVSASKPIDEMSAAVNNGATAATTKHNGSRDSNPNTWTCRRALGMDTRFLATTQGNLVAERVVQEYTTFVQTTVVRGVAPIWLASTMEKPPAKPPVPGKHSKKGSSAIRVQLTALGNDKAKKSMGGRALFSLSKVQVQASSNEKDNKNDNTNGAVHIPKELLATNSWKALGMLGT